MATGKIKWFNSAKGFGFITPDEEGKDVFLHISALKAANLKEVMDGDIVEYQLQEFRDRQVATDIKVIKNFNQ
jgi:CspA family cold shock protein|tara:strand:+ start:153 stop:371 length:219 start_codon:yes stop_codon:yes gene_type:complete